MRKVILYIAMSLDGYIADEQGNVDWLTGGEDTSPSGADSYAALLERIDTVIMGYRTYHQIKTQLSPASWPYPNLQSYIITHHTCEAQEGLRFTNQTPVALVQELKAQEGKDIWICGGAMIASSLIGANEIDEYQIAVIPTLLGKGIPLFRQGQKILLEGISSRIDNGILECVYKKRE